MNLKSIMVRLLNVIWIVPLWAVFSNCGNPGMVRNVAGANESNSPNPPDTSHGVSKVCIDSPMPVVDEPFKAGSGTQKDPYIIHSPGHLSSVRSFESSHFQLDADIDLSCLKFEPIASFSGNLNGAGHTILGWDYRSASSSGLGLFGTLSGSVKNLKLTNFHVFGAMAVGGLAAYLTTGASIQNISITNSDVLGSRFVGGLVGSALCAPDCLGSTCQPTCLFDNIVVDASITADAGAIADSVGGLLGSGSWISASNIRTKGSLNCHSGSCGGGVGDLSNSKFEKVLSAVFIRAPYAANVGGIAGALKSTSLQYCGFTGDMTGGMGVGGIVGRTNGTLVRMEQCFAIGRVGATSNQGGVVGLSVGVPVQTNNYWGYDPLFPLFGTTQATSARVGSGLVGQSEPLTSDQMKDPQNYVGWDFEKTWCMNPGALYPDLCQ